MRISAAALALSTTLFAPVLWADEPAATPSKGIAVIALDGATDAAWPLAQKIYGSAVLRPAHMDDAHARVLAGEAPPEGSLDLKEMSELRAGVKGDDAASRELLTTLAKRVSVGSLLVVFPTDPPSARLFVATSHTFDAARYQGWDATLQSLERQANGGVVAIAPTAPAPQPLTPIVSKPFYASPWFWVAIGAAVLIGGGVLIATNVQTSDTIHLQLRIP